MFKTAIFDLDGTLADTFLSIANTCNQALIDAGLHELGNDFYKNHIGIGLENLIERAIVETGANVSKYVDRVLSLYQEKFNYNYTYKIKLYPKINSTLEQLKTKGIRLAVLTNKKHEIAVDVVDYLFGKGDIFDLILGQKENVPLKPHPEGALLIADTFGCNPEECVLIGDTEVDIQTGKNARMYTVGVLWGFRSKEKLAQYQPDRLIQNPEELLGLFTE